MKFFILAVVLVASGVAIVSGAPRGASDNDLASYWICERPNYVEITVALDCVSL